MKLRTRYTVYAHPGLSGRTLSSSYDNKADALSERNRIIAEYGYPADRVSIVWFREDGAYGDIDFDTDDL